MTDQGLKKKTIVGLFNSAMFAKEFVEKNTELFRERESREFLSNVEILKTEVDQLMHDMDTDE